VIAVLQYGLWLLEATRHWEKENIEKALFGLAKQMDIKVRDFLFPFFMAIAGTSSTISVLDTMALLGPDMSRARIRYAIDVLGAPGKKKLKKLEKDFQVIVRAIEALETTD
jgi:glutamyl-tRNA synthetase